MVLRRVGRLARDRFALALAAGVLAFAATPHGAVAQDACETSVAAAALPSAGDPPFGYRFTAGDFRDEAGVGRWIRFLTEPVVTSIAPDGPVEGLLRVGDGIEAIDGALITTETGSRRFATLGGEGGEPAAVVVRRDGRSITVRVPSCRLPDAQAPDAVVLDSADRRAGSSGTRTPSAAANSGMRLRCLACSYDEREGWRFSTRPIVTEVRQGSPAARAGLSPGDELVAIDGVRLGTYAGDQRFSRLGAGDRASWTVRRGERTLEITWTLGG